MANIITAGNSTNGGTAISTDTSGTLNIVTGSGSGANAITIDASQVVTMPGTLAVTGAQTIGGNLTVTGSITGGSISVANSLRAWVNFNGTGTVSIRASGNVTSITDNGTGDYTVNFTTAMPDANYSPAFSTKYRDSVGSLGAVWAEITDKVGIASAMTTTSLRITTASSSTIYDIPVVGVSIFR